MAKKVIAELPPMEANDYEEFEKVHPWGSQRATRRKQLEVAAFGSLAGGTSGWVYSVFMRRNTHLVGYLMALMFGVSGGIIGNYAGVQMHPNVTSNAEARMMRRLWWAQKCSADWKYDIPSDWSLQYPTVDCSKLARS
ncbi:hypothetical protein DIPPA_34914 [Diplonema papillatum]|nr:hypothetical protein DIPPA_34914 [Diplonema papillatum]